MITELKILFISKVKQLLAAVWVRDQQGMTRQQRYRGRYSSCERSTPLAELEGLREQEVVSENSSRHLVLQVIADKVLRAASSRDGDLVPVTLCARQDACDVGGLLLCLHHADLQTARLSDSD